MWQWMQGNYWLTTLAANRSSALRLVLIVFAAILLSGCAGDLEPGKLVNSGIDLFQKHTIVAIAIVVALGIFAYLKPKELFKLVIAFLIIGAVVYVISFLVDLTSTGMDDKDKFTRNPETKID